MPHRIPLILAALFLAAIPAWLWIVAPQFTKLPRDFSYEAEVFSLDNFYDEQTQAFSGAKRSITKFLYTVAGSKEGNLLIKNIFDVRTVANKTIFGVERLYGIDPKTRGHVSGIGDRDRDGYLFAPRHLKKGQPFTYWHINYDGPARMRFAGEEVLFGLPVYRYETRYEGVRIDQTNNLGYLPGVGITRGVELEPFLQLWIEPVSGHLVNYKDETIAYYYNLKTGARIHPWNSFTNTFTKESVIEQVGVARQEKIIGIVIDIAAPVLFLVLAVLFALYGFFGKKSIAIASGIFLVGLLVGFFVSQKPQTPADTTSFEKLTLALPHPYPEAHSLINLANELGYFTKNNLEVVVQERDSSAAVVQALNEKNIDIGAIGDFKCAAESFAQNQLRILASFTKANHLILIGRKDKGIFSPMNLRGKKIGLNRNTMLEFFLGEFLIKNHLSLQDVELVAFQNAEEFTGAFEEGRVDAIIASSQSIYELRQDIKEQSIYWPVQGDQPYYWLAVIHKDTVPARAAAVTRFIKALVAAEDYLKKYPTHAKALIGSRLSRKNQEYLFSNWSKFQFTISLPQELIVSLEDQARWIIKNTFTRTSVIPNYLDTIYFDALEAIKPEAVTIVH